MFFLLHGNDIEVGEGAGEQALCRVIERAPVWVILCRLFGQAYKHSTVLLCTSILVGKSLNRVGRASFFIVFPRMSAVHSL